MFKVTNTRTVGAVFFQGQSIGPGQSIYLDTLPAHIHEDLRVTGSGHQEAPPPVTNPPDNGNQTSTGAIAYLTMSEAKAWAKEQDGGAEDDVPEMLKAGLIPGAHKEGTHQAAPWRIPKAALEAAYPDFLLSKAEKEEQ